ncbi:protein of unknown function [Methylocella tundrae]|uniref:TIR domain-containing protein n=1 Tax=Methylocella tundrae TaxID=227605 RepID=A0A4U8Z5H8_METTU|nr:protein of unknown function [Methylocella tundrae]
MARIFLSHSSKNNAAAIALRDWIIADGRQHGMIELNPSRCYNFRPPVIS